MEIPQYAGRLYVPEQAPHIAAAGESQPGDGMALPLEGAAEGGDGCEVRAGQINVRLQIDGFPLGPAVQSAVPGEFRQILRCAEIYAIGITGCQSGGDNEGEKQNRRQQEAQEFTGFPFHLILGPP